MFENYLCINGKKTKLTDEQMRQLGITPVESEIAKMSRISKAGEAEAYYNVHDTIVVDGITFEIVGIGHDIDALTGKYNTITLRQVDHIKKSRIDPGSCPDGFAASELDKFLIKSPQSWIPESILPYVRTVSKEYVMHNGSIKVMCRKLWVFSESEMFGSAIYSPAGIELLLARRAPLVRLGCVPRISVTPASFVWSTLLDSRAIAMPWTRMAWRWASAFDIESLIPRP